jgi:hypothetical protein
MQQCICNRYTAKDDAANQLTTLELIFNLEKNITMDSAPIMLNGFIYALLIEYIESAFR